MMSTPSSLHLLVDLGKNHLDEAGQQLHSLNQEKQAAHHQLAMLQDYREDYVQRLNNAGQHGLTMSNYHNFIRFIATLDEAIQQQNKVLLQLDEKIANSRVAWNQKRIRLNGYETLVDRREQAERQQQQRKEQIQTDEISARLFAKAPSAY